MGGKGSGKKGRARFFASNPSLPLSLLLKLTTTSPYMPGNDKHPSSNGRRGPPDEMTRGLTSTTSSSGLAASPSGLNTMRRRLTPTWGAARPTPSSSDVYIASNMARAILAKLSSKNPTRALGARRRGSG